MPAHRKYPLPEMQPGETRELPEKKRLANYVWARGAALGMKFETRRIGNKRQVTRTA